jgi:hypothetical protein
MIDENGERIVCQQDQMREEEERILRNQELRREALRVFTQPLIIFIVIYLLFVV